MILVVEERLKLGDTTVPGILKSVSCKGSLIINDEKVEGTSKTIKQLAGWEDNTISINLILISGEDAEGKNEKTVYEQTEEIERIFKKAESGVPVVYEIKNDLLNARKVKKVLFDSFDSIDSVGSQGIECTLTFVEYEPVVKKTQDKQNTTKKKEDNKELGDESEREKDKKDKDQLYYERKKREFAKMQGSR